MFEPADGAEANLDRGRRPPLAREGQHVAPLQLRAVDADEVRGDTRHGSRRVDGTLVALQPADPGPGSGRIQLDLAPDLERSSGEGARHHRPGPPDRENAIDELAGAAV